MFDGVVVGYYGFGLLCWYVGLDGGLVVVIGVDVVEFFGGRIVWFWVFFDWL